MRLIDGDVTEVVSREDAEKRAEETGLDLVIMSLTSSPPVVKLIDYGKFKFEAEKKAREAKKKQHTVEVKEIKLGIRIDDHDLEVKIGRAKAFLHNNDKVKFTIRLKGREVQHSNLAHALARSVVEKLDGIGALEGNIRQESARLIIFFFSPDKALAKATAKTAKEQSDAAQAAAMAESAEAAEFVEPDDELLEGGADASAEETSAETSAKKPKLGRSKPRNKNNEEDDILMAIQAPSS